MNKLDPNMKNYEETRENFRLEVPEYFNFGFDIVDKAAADPTKLALISVGSTGENVEKHTFFDIKIGSNKFANLLYKLGVGKGDRAFTMVARIPEWYTVMIGMMKTGVIPMPSTTLLTSHDIEYRINRAEATVAIADLDNAPKVEEIAASCPSLKHLILVKGTRRGWINCSEELLGMAQNFDAIEPTLSDDPLLIYFTSGTVGQPKMVLHTQASYAIAHTITARFWQDLKSTDIHCCS